jgi:transposase
MEAYAVDLRKRVLADCDAGMGTKEVAAKYRVSESWVRRLKQRRRETGVVAPLPRSGGRPLKVSGTREKRLKELLKKHPDATLHELHRRLRLKCSVSTVHLAVIRLGMSFKKSRCMPVSSSVPT